MSPTTIQKQISEDRSSHADNLICDSSFPGRDGTRVFFRVFILIPAFVMSAIAIIAFSFQFSMTYGATHSSLAMAVAAVQTGYLAGAFIGVLTTKSKREKTAPMLRRRCGGHQDRFDLAQSDFRLRSVQRSLRDSGERHLRRHRYQGQVGQGCRRGPWQLGSAGSQRRLRCPYG